MMPGVHLELVFVVGLGLGLGLSMINRVRVRVRVVILLAFGSRAVARASFLDWGGPPCHTFVALHHFRPTLIAHQTPYTYAIASAMPTGWAMQCHGGGSNGQGVPLDSTAEAGLGTASV